MNFYDLINKCLLELNYKQVEDFEELIKTDHLKIKQTLNRVNNEVCASFDWVFLQRRTTIDIPMEQTSETEQASGDNGAISNPPCGVPGRIDMVKIDGQEYRYTPDYKAFLAPTNESAQIAGKYSMFNNSLLFPPSAAGKTADIIYYTNNCVVDENGVEKAFFENETDKTLIPEYFCEPLLVYGACMRTKANPEHVKFKYWYGMYNETLSAMRSRGSSVADDNAEIIMERGF